MAARRRPTSAQRTRVVDPVFDESMDATGSPGESFLQSSTYTSQEWKQKLQTIQAHSDRVTYSPGPSTSTRNHRPVSAGHRPTSATRRPLSAKSQRSTEPLSARPASSRPSSARPTSARGLADVYGETPRKARATPSAFYVDPETMYEQIQKLKKNVHELTEERTQLRSKIIRFDGEIVRKEKQMENLLQSKSVSEMGGGKFDQLRSEAHLLKNLKRKIADLDKTISQRDDEISRLKNDSKYTRVAELELELRTYYNESKRLQKLLESSAREESSIITGGTEADSQIRQLSEKNMQLKGANHKLQLQAEQLEQDMRSMNDENDRMKRQIDDLRQQLASSRGRVQDTPQEVRKLQTQHASTVAALEQQHQLKLSELNSKTSILNDQLQSKASAQRSLEDERERLQQRLRDEELRNSKQRDEARSLEQQLADVRRQLNDAESRAAAAKRAEADARAALQAAQSAKSAPSPVAVTATAAPVQSAPVVVAQPVAEPAFVQPQPAAAIARKSSVSSVSSAKAQSGPKAVVVASVPTTRTVRSPSPAFSEGMMDLSGSPNSSPLSSPRDPPNVRSQPAKQSPRPAVARHASIPSQSPRGVVQRRLSDAKPPSPRAAAKPTTVASPVASKPSPAATPEPVTPVAAASVALAPPASSDIVSDNYNTDISDDDLDVSPSNTDTESNVPRPAPRVASLNLSRAQPSAAAAIASVPVVASLTSPRVKQLKAAESPRVVVYDEDDALSMDNYSVSADDDTSEL
eukprot:TRINITY_DN2912_c0_g2_i1.p1 TRINITY_DN2912_c0_g2~~TRINITY_DN2912_c0_g2_i1.p1  ORF type:complete len:751 (+),score=237.26 TRINITY_DN2912_c0_g2_i1:100-2352(+)